MLLLDIKDKDTSRETESHDASIITVVSFSPSDYELLFTAVCVPGTGLDVSAEVISVNFQQKPRQDGVITAPTSQTKAKRRATSVDLQEMLPKAAVSHGIRN